MTDEIHKYGTDDGWHGVIEEGGQFPPAKARYHLYIGTSLDIILRIRQFGKYAEGSYHKLSGR